MFACASKPLVWLSKPAGASEVTAYSTGTASTPESASPRVTRRLLFDCCLAIVRSPPFGVNLGHGTHEPRPSPAPADSLPHRWTADPSHACRGCKRRRELAPKGGLVPPDRALRAAWRAVTPDETGHP